METSSLIRHFQAAPLNQVQGWHPHTFVRWLFFLVPLIYFALMQINVIRRVEWLRQKYWVSTQSRSLHFMILFGLFELIVFGYGLYAVITDAWSTKEWVLWTFALIFGAFTLLAFATNDSCGVNFGLILAALLGFACFFFHQWLFAQTRDMHQNIWKHIVRNLIGFVTALVLFQDILLWGRVLVYVFGASQSTQAKFFWVVGILAAIGLTVLNILAYGPFVDVIGFIIGCILCFILAYLFDTNEIKNIHESQQLPTRSQH